MHFFCPTKLMHFTTCYLCVPTLYLCTFIYLTAIIASPKNVLYVGINKCTYNRKMQKKNCGTHSVECRVRSTKWYFYVTPGYFARIYIICNVHTPHSTCIDCVHHHNSHLMITWKTCFSTNIYFHECMWVTTATTAQQ